MQYGCFRNMFEMINSIYEEVGSIDPFTIADYFDIEYRYVNASNAFCGETTYILGKPLLLLNEKLQEDRYKYPIMTHEVFHALEHPGLTSYYSTGASQKNKLEYQANQFTAALLFCLYQFWYDREPTYSDLQHEFNLDNEFYNFYF